MKWNCDLSQGTRLVDQEELRDMPIATSAFHWRESYSVNIEELDQHRQKLFMVISDFNDGLSSGKGHVATYVVLQQLSEFAQSYFAKEEALMAKHCFLGLITHRVEHHEFTEKLARFKREFRNGKSDVPVQLLLYLQSWLRDHILASDKACGGYLNARGVK